jgi:integrase
MRWSEVRENGTLWVIPGERTKNGAVHDVPLSGPAQKLLEGLPRLGGAEYVFTTTGKTPVSGYSNAKERLDAVMLQLARDDAAARGEEPDRVQVQPWRLHDLRRTVASGMARLRQPVHVIEAVLNHRSGTISGVAAVYNRYNYLARLWPFLASDVGAQGGEANDAVDWQRFRQETPPCRICPPASPRSL